MIHNDIALYRIKRISDGLVGGWVQSEDSLSQRGECFIYDEAKVYDSARVFGKTAVFGGAEVTSKVLNAETHKHNITMTDNMIAIGCENHSYKHWKENIFDIGKNNGYSDKQIENTKKLLDALMAIKEGLTC